DGGQGAACRLAMPERQHRTPVRVRAAQLVRQRELRRPAWRGRSGDRGAADAGRARQHPGLANPPPARGHHALRAGARGGLLLPARPGRPRAARAAPGGMMAEAEARLIAFPPSVDTETARGILGHHGVAFREVRQSALGAALRTLWHRAKIPILFAEGAKRSPSRPIADLLDADAPPERRLVPDDPALAAQIEPLWEELNGRLGLWVAQWIYHEVLGRPELALRLMANGR